MCSTALVSFLGPCSDFSAPISLAAEVEDSLQASLSAHSGCRGSHFEIVVAECY